MYEKKVWGIAKHVFSSPHCAVSILETLKGGYCSRHKHRSRVNRFVVSSGSIDVVEYTDDGQIETSRKTLNAGDTADVHAGIVHRFEVNEPGVVIEVYWPSAKYDEVRLTDIERLDTGGMNGRLSLSDASGSGSGIDAATANGSVVADGPVHNQQSDR